MQADEEFKTVFMTSSETADLINEGIDSLCLLQANSKTESVNGESWSSLQGSDILALCRPRDKRAWILLQW